MLDYMTQYPFPGKYEGELRLVEYLDDQDADDECGDVEVTGNHRLYDLRTWQDAETGGTKDPTIVAAILSTNSQGFVSGTYFESYEAARAEFDGLATEADAAAAEDDDV